MSSASSTQPSDVSLLKQHDARLDLLVTQIGSALHQPDATLESIADRATELAEKAEQSGPHQREILSRTLQKTLLQEISRGEGFSEGGGLRVIDLTIELVRRHKADAKLAPNLLEILFVSHSQSQLVNAIPALRARFEALREPVCSVRPADAFTIKSINACNRRDSPASNPTLFGHLHLMLNASLKPWHPSSTRRSMHYCAKDFEKASAELDLDGTLKDQLSTPGDGALYKAFWTAHAAMKNPSLAESPSHWRHVSACMDRVLGAFKTIPPVKEMDHVIPKSGSKYSSKSNNSKDGMDVDINGNKKNNSNSTDNKDVEDKADKDPSQSRIPKHLTSPSVLRLQIEDIRVRRHVLLQYAIFLHHLEMVSHQNPTEKDSIATKTAIEFCKTLFVTGGEGTRMKKMVYDVITSDDTAKFKRFVSSLLQRERRWVHWKRASGYGHLVVPRSVAPTVFKRRKVRSKVVTEKTAFSKRSLTDNAWRSRQSAWVVPPSKERAEPLVERAQAELWSEDVLKMELKEDMDDEDVTDDMKRKNDSKYVWRTLRMLCEGNLQCITTVSKKDGTLDLEALIKNGKIPKKEKTEVVNDMKKVEPGDK